MLNKNTMIKCLLSIALLIYLGFALKLTADMAYSDKFAGLDINIIDSAQVGFVTKVDISREAGDLAVRIDTLRRCDLNLQRLENLLRKSDKIETVNVSVLNSGKLRIDVKPMVPVARVFTPGQKSYYINAEGKKISADVKYHIDVPIVCGYFNSKRPPERLLPLLAYIAADSALNALVSTVIQQRNGDIVIMPTIRGHVINFGDTTNVADKFNRLTTFYRKVMPVKGWSYYDTVAVKWNDRVIANRRTKRMSDLTLNSTQEDYSELVDIDAPSMDELNEGIVPDSLDNTNTSNAKSQ
jgi:cell division protein FtsQ